MCDLICCHLVAIFEAAIPVKSMHIISSLKIRKKREKMKIKEIFYIHLHLMP